jgi:V8-like Glu-specific endopeptidase
MRCSGGLYGIIVVACFAGVSSQARAKECPKALDVAMARAVTSLAATTRSPQALGSFSTKTPLVECGFSPLPDENPPQVNPKIFDGTPAPDSQLTTSPPPVVQASTPGAPPSVTPSLDSARFPVDRTTAAPDIPTSLVVAIIYQQTDGGHLCTGTLIDPTHVLTAGHCGCGENYFISRDTYVPLNDPAALKQLISMRAIQVSLPPILFDQSVCKNGPKAGNDLALLVLPPQSIACKVALSSRAAAANGVPSPADCRSDAAQQDVNAVAKTFGYPDDKFWNLMPQLPQGRKLTVAGYGYTENRTDGRLLEAAVPVASTACTEPRWAKYCSPFSEMILAEPPGPNLRHDTCQGDSGGPVFLIDSGGYTLIAVTSRPAPGIADDPVLECGGGGIYTIIGRQTVKAWLQASGVSVARTLPAPSAAGLK